MYYNLYVFLAEWKLSKLLLLSTNVSWFNASQSVLHQSGCLRWGFMRNCLHTSSNSMFRRPVQDLVKLTAQHLEKHAVHIYSNIPETMHMMSIGGHCRQTKDLTCSPDTEMWAVIAPKNSNDIRRSAVIRSSIYSGMIKETAVTGRS